MRISSKIPVTILLLCMFAYGFYVQQQPKASSLSTISETLQAMMARADASLAIASPVPKQHCTVQGPLPDHECTPGAVFPDATKEIICV